MKILTWNCCLPPWLFTRKQRLPQIVSLIISESPDIVCLQEVFFKSDANFIINELKQNDYINFFHFKNLLISSKFPFIKKEGFVFKKQGSLFSWGILDVLYGKAFQLVSILYNEKTISLINTHLLSAKACSCSDCQTIRISQVQEICNASKQPVLVVGDFNFQPNTKPYKKIIQSGFSDFCNQKITTVKKKRFDYIFSSGIESLNIIPVFLEKNISDHIGLLGILTFCFMLI